MPFHTKACKEVNAFHMYALEEYRDVLLNPKHGYGKNMNPCLDCKGFMVKKAKQWMLEHDFDFNRSVISLLISM
jgi:tRNA U34 2-thiouridine synthase MnmA/TrmU